MSKHFHLGAVSDVVATASANGVVFAWRNPSGSVVQYIQRIRVVCTPVVTPTTTNDQEFALSMHLQSTFSANYTGGKNLSDPATPANYAVRNTNVDVQRVLQSAQLPASAAATGNIRIADTSTLTAGGGDVIEVHPWIFNSIKVPGATAAAAGATLPSMVLEWHNPMRMAEHIYPQVGCLPLFQDKGFIVRAPVAIANSLSVRIAVDVDWLE